jgi:MerR family transcriptional regulator, light-induced transcriptional regulator
MDAFHMQVSETIEARRTELAEAIVDRQYRVQPELVTRYGEIGRAKCLQDTMHHLSSISSAIALSTPETFVDYVTWVRSLLEARNIPAEDLALNLACVRDVLRDELPPDVGAVAVEYVEAGLGQLPRL